MQAANSPTEDWFRLIVEAVPNAIIIVDQERTITLVNCATEALFGYERSELMGQAIETLMPARFRGDHPNHVAQFLVEPQTRSMGVGRDPFGRRKDGREIPIEIGLNPIETPDGHFTLASITDLSDRKRAIETEQRMAALVESANDAIMTRDLDGTIRSWNPGAERLLGYSPDDIIGQSVTRLLLDDRQGEETMLLALSTRKAPAPTTTGVIQNGFTSVLPVTSPDSSRRPPPAEAERLADLAIVTVQRIATELRPSVLDALGLSAAIRDEVRRFGPRAGIGTHVTACDGPQPSPRMATALFRILQELLTNVARHSRASQVIIDLTDDGESWILRVEDDGIGVPTDADHTSTSLGLVGIRERAGIFGGTLTLGAAPRGGTIATVRVPKTSARQS